MPDYDADPKRYDRELRIGDTFTLVARLENAGVAYDITGVTGEMSLVPEVGGAAVLSPTFSIVDAAEGRFKCVSAYAATASLSAGRYLYAVRLTWPSGHRSTVLAGTITIVKGVL